jgi:PDZ domain
MFEFTAKRQRTIASFFCLSLSLVIMVSCTAPVVTIARISQRADVLIGLLELAKQISIETSKSVNTSYQDLGEYLRSENFSNSTIETMEAQHLDLSTKHNKLTDTLNKTETEAGELFSLLKANADANTTPELKAKMSNDISVKKQAFEARISIAQGVSVKLKTSIQKYRDILGYLQNKAGTEMIPSYIKEVDGFIAQAESLNQEVQTALDEGRQIIKKIDTTADSGSVGTTITPTPDQTAPQQEEIPVPTPRTSTLPSTSGEAPTQQQVQRPFLGVEMVNLTSELRQKIEADSKTAGINIDINEGVLVTKVVENSPAATAGIKPGDVIVAIDGKAVTESSEISADIGKSQVGAELPLQVHRDRQTIAIVVRLGANPNP